MTKELSISELSILDLIKACQDESDKYIQNIESNPNYCFELFNRAITLKENEAWDAIVKTYKKVVEVWVVNCPSFLMVNETADYFVNRSFERFWQAVDQQKFMKFTSLSGVLRYLKMCVNSVIIDYSRYKEMLVYDKSLSIDNSPDIKSETNVEMHVANRTLHAKLWELVQERLKDERERVVMYEFYLLGLKPREIFSNNAELFKSTKEISRIKENVLARLKRDNSFINLLSDA